MVLVKFILLERFIIFICKISLVDCPSSICSRYFYQFYRCEYIFKYYENVCIFSIILSSILFSSWSFFIIALYSLAYFICLSMIHSLSFFLLFGALFVCFLSVFYVFIYILVFLNNCVVQAGVFYPYVY